APPVPEALADLLARLVALAEPLRVVIERPGLCVTLLVGLPEATPKPPQKPPHAPVHPVRTLILDVQADAHPRRLTRPEIVTAFARQGKEWSERHVARFLDELREEGVIDNARDDRGQGYGFAPDCPARR